MQVSCFSSPALAVLLQQSSSSALAPVLQSPMSCHCCRVLAVLPPLSVHDLSVPICQTELSRAVRDVLSQICSKYSIPVVQFVPSRLSWRGYRALAIMFWPFLSSLFCPCCIIPIVLSVCHVLQAVLSWLFCPSCPVPAALPQLFCPSYPVLTVLSQLSCSSCSASAALSQLSCPGCSVPAVLGPVEFCMTTV
jgi:hypothetical protein